MSSPDSVPGHLQPVLALPLFRGLSKDDALGLLEIAEPLTLAPNEVLFSEGAPGDGLYIVLQGHLDVLKRDGTGAQQSLAVVEAGGVLGEMSLVGTQTARSATVRAQSACRLLRLPASRFQRLVHADSLPALRLVHNLAQLMSRRLLQMDERLVGMLDRARQRQELANFQHILSDWSF